MRKVTTKPAPKKEPEKKVQKKATEKKQPVKTKPAVKKTPVVKPKKEAAKPLPETPTMAAFPSVKRGDQNGYITLLQTNLQNRGYYAGKVDGKFGPKTEQAVMDFQKDLGKPVSGSVGPKTWEALQKSNVVKLQAKKEEPIIQPEVVRQVAPPPANGVSVIIEGLTRYQADLLVKLFQGHTDCRIL